MKRVQIVRDDTPYKTVELAQQAWEAIDEATPRGSAVLFVSGPIAPDQAKAVGQQEADEQAEEE